MTTKTNDCIDCRHYKKDADDKVYCNFYHTSVSKCKIQYCGIFSPRDIYIVDGVEMNAKEYIRHLESENERLQQQYERIPIIENGDIRELDIDDYSEGKELFELSMTTDAWQQIGEAVEQEKIQKRPLTRGEQCDLDAGLAYWDEFNFFRYKKEGVKNG